MAKDYNFDISDWYLTPQGKAVFSAEMTVLNNLAEKMFGDYLLQLGGPKDADFLSAIKVHKQIYLNPSLKFLPSNCDYSICGNFHELPFAPGSIDVTIVAHVLEFIRQPRQMLREIFDVLVPEGYMVIFGFNPHSLWGLMRMFKNKHAAPWSGHFITFKHLCCWLEELSFSVLSYQTLLFRPVSDKKENLNKLLLMEGFGEMFCPSLGGVYAIVAQKKIVTLTPVATPLWQRFSPAAAATDNV